MPMWTEVRRAVRRLASSPAFALASILTLAAALLPAVLGGMARAAIVPTLPFPEPRGLVSVGRVNSVGYVVASSYPRWQFLHEHAQTVDIAAFGSRLAKLAGAGDDVPIVLERVTANFFDVLRLTPAAGRFLGDEDLRLGAAVAVVSEKLWKERLAGSPDALGRTLEIDGTPFTVVGVMPGAFHGVGPGIWARYGQKPIDIWIPLTCGTPREKRWLEPTAVMAQWLTFFGRVREPHTLRGARAEVTYLSRRMIDKWPASGTADFQPMFSVAPLAEAHMDRDVLFRANMLRAAALLLLLVASINVASLFAARAADREGQSAIRVALGATRWSLLRADLLDAGVVAGASAAVALLAVAALARASSGLWTLRIGWEDAAQAFALALVSAVVFGLSPGLRAMRADFGRRLTSAAGPSGRAGLRSLRPTGARGLLIVVQVGVAVALVVPSVLLLRSRGNALTFGAGIRASGLLAVDVSASDAVKAHGLVESIRRIPGVDEAALALCLPLSRGCQGSVLRTREGGPDLPVAVNVVSDGYLATFGVPLLEGRAFSAHDHRDAPKVALLSAAAARRLGGRALGRRVDVGGFVMGETAEVVGVVGDVQYDDPVEPRRPAVYLFTAQYPAMVSFVAVRQSAGVQVGPALRTALGSADSALREGALVDIPSRMNQGFARFRLAAGLLVASAGVAVFLTTIGIYGLVAWSVSRSRFELAVRAAIGASPRELYGLVTGVALRLGVAGLLGGTACGAAASTRLRPLLFGVEPLDGAAVAAAVSVAAAMAFAAAFLPARRAARVDPALALRSE
jgi:putative ABC transport system permease protein